MKKAIWVNVLLVVVLAGSLTMLVGCFGSNPFFDLNGTAWVKSSLTLMQYAQIMPIYNLDLEFGSDLVGQQVKPAEAPENAYISFNVGTPGPVSASDILTIVAGGQYTQTGNDFTATFSDVMNGDMVPQVQNPLVTITVTGAVLDPDTLNVTNMTVAGEGHSYTGSFQMSPAQ
jgi:hypothetical protein